MGVRTDESDLSEVGYQTSDIETDSSIAGISLADNTGGGAEPWSGSSVPALARTNKITEAKKQFQDPKAARNARVLKRK